MPCQLIRIPTNSNQMADITQTIPERFLADKEPPYTGLNDDDAVVAVFGVGVDAPGFPCADEEEEEDAPGGCVCGTGTDSGGMLCFVPWCGCWCWCGCG